MKRIAIALATSAMALTVMAGTAAAENDKGTWTPKCEAKPGYEHKCNGGQYPPAPKQVYLPTPSVDYGSSLTVKGKGLCPGVPAIFAVQSNADWTNRVFSAGQWVAEDGTSWYTFSASELSNIYGPVTVYVKQFGKCEGAATTGGTIVKKMAPAPAPKPVAPEPPAVGTKSVPEGSGGLIPASTPDTPAAPAAVPAVVLSSGVTAPAAAEAPAAVASATAAPTAAAAPAVAAQSGGNLPVTGSEPSQVLQIALVAFAAGLGMVIVTSIRRRTAGARTR